MSLFWDFGIITCMIEALWRRKRGFMAQFYPFRALRPAEGKAGETACLPYDVLSKDQADALAVNPSSFIHVIKSEVDLPDETDLYSDEIYETAAKNLKQMQEDGILRKAEGAEYYIYREITSDHTQTGVVGTVSCREYEEGIIKRHELTVAEKEDDRTRHILACRAQTGLVFLTFRHNDELSACIREVTAAEPEENFAKDGVTHQVWAVTDPEMTDRIRHAFMETGPLYIADGHHRAASSCRAARQLGADDSQEAGRFMACAFPAEDLSLLGYHRYVSDLNGMTEEEFLEKIRTAFDIETCDAAVPSKPHQIIMYLGDKAYALTPHEDVYDPSDSIERLDVSILQKQLLAPVLGINDPRRDRRISFSGGPGAAEEIRALAKKGGAGFILYPTSIDDLMAVADDNGIMPPKSTWFEPKLLSGLFIHEL